MTPTKAQIGLMSRAYELRKYHGADGVYPMSGSQKAALARLEAAGLMRFAGFGMDIDGERDGDLPVWEITERGERVLRDLGEIEAQP